MESIKIFLDDLRDPPDDSWTVCRTAEEAILKLSEENVEEISLDHDLGAELTGYDVAKYIEQQVVMNRMPCPRWSVHSANPVGRQNIAAAMIFASESQNRDFSKRKTSKTC